MIKPCHIHLKSSISYPQILPLQIFGLATPLIRSVNSRVYLVGKTLLLRLRGGSSA